MDSFTQSLSYFPTQMQLFQYYDKYARFDYALGRRETWVETVDRTINYLRELSKDRLDPKQYEKIRKFILEMKVMPSMRLLAMAGDTARRNNLAIYNCSFMGVNDLRTFGEAMLISMYGCGVGYSVESEHIERLPRLPKEIRETHNVYRIEDTAEGWKDAIDFHLDALFNGELYLFDYSQLRPAGAPLITKGGQASGPEPLREAIDRITYQVLHHYGYPIFNENSHSSGYVLKADYRSRLTSLDAHDIMTTIGGAAISGGVRRTAMIALFDVDDRAMLRSKSPDNIHFNKNRYNANNSAVWKGEVDDETYLVQMAELFSSKMGEPGIFSKDNAFKTAPIERRNLIEKYPELEIVGTNPCGEINLPDMGLCNLSAAIAREYDTYESLAEKVEVATWIGTIQSMATYFPNMRPQWSINAERQHLLGVDITGQMDSLLLTPDLQTDLTFDWDFQSRPYAEVRIALRNYARTINKETAIQLSINPSVAVTTVKPSGNTSVLVDCASGMHPRYAPYYIRNIELMKTSPLYFVLIEHNAPMIEHPHYDDRVLVQFPVKSPDNALVRTDLDVIDMLEYWRLNKLYYTDHNPSATIYYEPDEIMILTNWVWEQGHIVGGISFLPKFDTNYAYLPYHEISKEEYEKRAAAFPEIDWSRLQLYEKVDSTYTVLECTGAACDFTY